MIPRAGSLARKKYNLESVIAVLLGYAVVAQRNQQAAKYLPLVSMTQAYATPQGILVKGDIEDTTDPYKRDKIYRAVAGLPDSPEKDNLIENLHAKDHAALILEDYLNSEEGSYVMGKYGLDRDDVQPAGMNLGEGTIAATTKQIKPYPIIFNSDELHRYESVVRQFNPNLTDEQCRNMAVRHELRHLTQPAGLLALVGDSQENRAYVEMDNSYGLFTELISEMASAKTDEEKCGKAQEAHASLMHYVQNRSLYHAARNEQYDVMADIARINNEVAKELGSDIGFLDS